MPIRRQSRLFVILVLLSFLGATSATGSESQPRDGKLLRALAIEWIPLYAHKQVLESLEVGLSQAGNLEFEVGSVCAYGDSDELAKRLGMLAEDPPAIVLSFGNYITQRVVELGPKRPVLALLARNPAGLVGSGSGGVQRLTVVDSDPDPKLVWRLACELAPNTDTLGVLHTNRFEPNVALVRTLDEEVRKHGGSVRSATVGAGFCRTDSDFQRGLDRIPESEEIDVLYIPDDPNCSRFGTQVYRYADAKGWPAIGSEATVGKGCVAAVAIDYEAIGRQAAEICLSVFRGEGLSTTLFHVPGRVFVDPKCLSAHAISMSPWLSENSEPFH